MKQFLLASVIFIAIAANAQSEKYSAAMQKNISAFSSAKTVAELESVAASFNRIGEAEKNQWLPYYWAALSLTRIGRMDEQSDKDVLASRIIALADKADSLTSENNDKSEILSLRSIAATQQMLVDPQSRYMTYGQQASGYLQKGLQLNAANPRLYYLQGMSTFNTPEQFGGGKAKAKPIFEKSVALYKAEQAKALYPQWGSEQATHMLSQCE
jgi:hypothetical protein